jgi:hypothetical protein
VLAETYRYEPVYFCSPGLLLPMMEVRTWATPARGVALPFSDFCPPLVEGGNASETWLRDILAFGRARKWRYVEIRGGGQLVKQPTPGHARYFVHQLGVQAAPEKVFSGFSASVRRAIRRSERLGVVAEIKGGEESLRNFWRLHVQTRRKHGVPPQPFLFMRKIHEHFLSKEQGFIAVARLNGRAVAACVFLLFGRRAVFKFGASDLHCQEVRGMNAAFWAGIKRLAESGIEVLHFGRTDMRNEGLRRFKLGWGASETILSYHRYDYQADSFVGECHRDRRGLSERLCRTMPVPVLKLMGCALYKHMA